MSCNFSILALLGWHCEWEAVCLGVWRRSNFSITKLAVWVL